MTAKDRLYYLFLGALFGLPPYMVTNEISFNLSGVYLNTFLDNTIPFWNWTIFIYIGVYVIVIIPVLILNDKVVMKQVLLGFFSLQYFAAFIFLLFPVHIARDHLIQSTDIISRMIKTLYRIDNPSNCFPSLHVANAFYVAFVASKFNRVAGYITWLVAILIALSTLTIKQHYIADVVLGSILGFLAYYIFIGKRYLTENQKYQFSTTPKMLWIFGLCYILDIVFFLVFSLF